MYKINNACSYFNSGHFEVGKILRCYKTVLALSDHWKVHLMFLCIITLHYIRVI